MPTVEELTKEIESLKKQLEVKDLEILQLQGMLEEEMKSKKLK